MQASLSPDLTCPKRLLDLSLRPVTHKCLPYTISSAPSCFSLTPAGSNMPLCQWNSQGKFQVHKRSHWLGQSWWANKRGPWENETLSGNTHFPLFSIFYLYVLSRREDFSENGALGVLWYCRSPGLGCVASIGSERKLWITQDFLRGIYCMTIIHFFPSWFLWMAKERN